ncbi:hypothetical protein [Promicromonospora sp. AC04]|uniref:hypothetical protein n=1 Tax=Promicromonospora sp. AC04 TaxID=2135723 RepID=UPI0011B200E4|nr:hypothetical protein [Promicromonospora sp. AC04]
MPVLEAFFARRVPAFLRALMIGVVVEVIGLVAFAVVLLGELLTGGSTSVGVSLFLVLFLLGVAWVLVVSCRALLAGRRSGRGPVVTWQLFQIIGSVAAIGSGTGIVVAGAWVALVIAVAVGVLLMTPSVVAATSATGSED